MYLLCHLAAGLIIGLILYWIFHDSNLIIAGFIGGITSDLIDKPIGHILFKNSLDYGRIYAHGLLFLLILFLLGILIWIKYRSLIGFSFSLGVLSHQILDRMWSEPENWFYPFLGPFIPDTFTNYLGNAFFREILNPYEWIFTLLIIIILIFSLFFYRENKFSLYFSYFRNISMSLIVISGLSGIFLFFPQNNTLGMIITGLDNPLDVHLSAFVMLLTSIFAGLCIIRVR